MHKLSASAAAQSAATDAGAESGPSGRGLVAVRAARVPRTVIAAPLRNQVDHMTAALDSLLAQTERDFALVLVDDLSNEDTARMARSYCDRDPRVHYQRNETRLGLVGNWRRCFELARELHPDAEYFAWASDHDLWQPRWLEAMVKALDGRPEVVLAYPTTERISADGQVSHTRGGCETLDVADAGTRLQRAHSDMHAGDMVYGLIRAGCLERAGVFRHVLEPDRLVLAELAVQGQFAHVPERLWQRRFLKTASRARQRRAIFPGRRPAHSWLPPSLVRPIVFLWVYVVRGAGRPDVSRRRGLALAWTYAVLSLVHVTRRRLAVMGKKLRRARKSLARKRKRARRRIRRTGGAALRSLQQAPRRADKAQARGRKLRARERKRQRQLAAASTRERETTGERR